MIRVLTLLGRIAWLIYPSIACKVFKVMVSLRGRTDSVKWSDSILLLQDLVATQLQCLEATSAKVPADNTQDLGSSNMSTGVQSESRSQPAFKDGSASFAKGSIAPYRYVQQHALAGLNHQLFSMTI